MTRQEFIRFLESDAKRTGRIFGCSVCRKSSPGYGCRASPINDGMCCLTCNIEIVAPARKRSLEAA